jgi:hypothetical protein
MQSKAKPSRVPAKRTQVINFAVFQQIARLASIAPWQGAGDKAHRPTSRTLRTGPPWPSLSLRIVVSQEVSLGIAGLLPTLS